jgi:hypothetical protein
MLPYNKIRICLLLIGKNNTRYNYTLEKIDLEKKEIFLEYGGDIARCFDYNIFSILRESKKGDYKVFIPKESTTFSVFSEVERNEEYMIGYLSLGYLNQNRWFRTAPSKRQDIITPDFYRYKGGKGNIYLSEVRVSNAYRPEEELGMFNSVIVRSENYREDKDVSNYLALAYSIVGIKKHKGETKNKPSGYNCHDLKISVWITREGNEFILGNTENDLVGALGFRLPSYHYRELGDGESRWVDIYCLKM